MKLAGNGDDVELYKRAETQYNQLLDRMANDVNPKQLTGGDMKSVVLRVVNFLDNLADVSSRRLNSFDV